MVPSEPATSNRSSTARRSGNLAGELEVLGYTVEVQTYQASTGVERNDIATRRGLLRPYEVIILAAHYHSMYEDPKDTPGADDNASDVATMLETASVLSS